MQTQQAKHSIPTMKQSRPLYGSGIERTLPYTLSSDFVSTAEEDGIVEKIDEKLNLAIIKYKSGKTNVIDLSSRQSKNSNGGFYISNQKEMLFKEGQKFKKNDILAKNPDYFLGESQNDVTFTQGYLCKVAMHSGDFTLEDSSLITDEVSEAMASNVTMMKSVQLGKNTNILSIVKKGDHIKTGEYLMTFEHSFENAEANKLLDSLDDDFANFVEEMGHDSIQSKYSGEVVDIKIYYNVDLDECSESVQKIIKDYNSEVNKRKNVMIKNGDISTVFPPTEQLTTNKIKGKEMEGILIEFYIRHLDKLQTGDKIVYGTAIKTIVSDVLPKGEEPYSEYRPEENIGAIFTTLSILTRMTTDSYCMLYTNKIIKELKQQCKEIWES